MLLDPDYGTEFTHPVGTFEAKSAQVGEEAQHQQSQQEGSTRLKPPVGIGNSLGILEGGLKSVPELPWKQYPGRHRAYEGKETKIKSGQDCKMEDEEKSHRQLAAETHHKGAQ